MEKTELQWGLIALIGIFLLILGFYVLHFGLFILIGILLMVISLYFGQKVGKNLEGDF